MIRNVCILQTVLIRGDIMKISVQMKKRLAIITGFLLCAALNVSAGEKAAESKAALIKVWETKKAFLVPESVLYNDGDNTLYISNIDGTPTDKDGKGFISKLSLDGKIIKLKWAEGLNAPKGSAIYKNSFYVSDIDRLVEIDMKTGKIKKTYPAKGALFLNDVAVDAEGRVYVTDMDEKNSAIYRLSGAKLDVWLKGPEIRSPNGLHMDQKKLMIGNSGDARIKAVRLSDKTVTIFADVREAMIDGLRPDGKGNYIISDWNGRTVLVLATGESKLLLDTTASKINSADIEYIPEKQLLLIPTFFDNRVVAYKLQ